MTRAIDCVSVKAVGGVDVSSAAAKTALFGRPIAGWQDGSGQSDLLASLLSLSDSSLYTSECQITEYWGLKCVSRSIWKEIPLQKKIELAIFRCGGFTELLLGPLR